MKTAALIGANVRRADGHASAYRRIEGVRLVAASARTPGAAEAFVQRWGLSHAFTDYHQMLRVVEPDIVHVNAPPTHRREILMACEATGVGGIVLEKPVGIDVEDLVWLEGFANSTRMRIAVNHQLHYHLSRRRMVEWIRAGRIGRLGYVEGSARHLLGYQGTHIIEGMTDIVGRPARWVTATAWGVDGLDDPGGHLSPDNVTAHIQFEDSVIGQFRCGLDTGSVVSDPKATERHHHKRLIAVGDEGVVEWTMWGLRLTTSKGTLSATSDYDYEDRQAQAALVQSLSAWMDGGTAVAVDLRSALAQFSLALAMYRSVLQSSTVDPADVGSAELIPQLRDQLHSH